MKKSGHAWEVVRTVEGSTRADTLDIRRAWGDADDYEDFLLTLDADQLVIVVCQTTMEGPDFARAARKAIEKIVELHGTEELKADMRMAGAFLDTWDCESPVHRSVWADLDYVAGMLIQSTEFAYRMNEVRSFPGAFSVLFTKIGQDRMTMSHGIVLEHLRPFLDAALEPSETTA